MNRFSQFFIGAGILTAIITAWTVVTERDFIFPIPHVGILTIVWRDYAALGILTTLGLFFFAGLAHDYHKGAQCSQ